MSTSSIGPAVPSHHTKTQSPPEVASENQDTVFADILRASEGNSDKAPGERFGERPISRDTGENAVELDLSERVLGFDRLGVLFVRRLSNGSEALYYGDRADSDLGGDPVDTLELNPLPDIPDVFTHDGSSDAAYVRMSGEPIPLQGLGSNLGVKPTQSRLAGIQSQTLSGSRPVLGAVATGPGSGVLEKAETESPDEVYQETIDEALQLEDILDQAASEIDVTVTRGETGLIVQVVAPSLESGLTRALEKRLQRLIEQSGEVLERIVFRAPEAPMPEFAIPGRTDNGSD